MTDSLMATYKRLPVCFERGEGAWLWDDKGQRYLDALSGIAVCGLGHAHPTVAQAIGQQAETLVHTSNLYEIKLQRSLGDKLTSLAKMDRVFFSNSGAEANEAAIKIARLYGHSKGIETPTIIVMENSFHGRTMATLSATGNRKVQAGFEPLVQGFARVPFNDIESLSTAAQTNKSIVAVLVEPIQGEGGIAIPSSDYLNQIRELCDQNEWLMMLDEVQTGMGRTGRMFAHQHNNIVPDVMTLAKSLGNGVPIGACLAKGTAAEILGPGTHGSTFGGSPLVCAAASAVLDILEKDQLTKRATTLGNRLLNGFQERLGQQAGVKEIRGCGLMIGIELDRPCSDLVGAALMLGKLLINVTADNVVRLLPPLVLTDEQADELIATLSGIIKTFLQKSNGSDT